MTTSPGRGLEGQVTVRKEVRRGRENRLGQLEARKNEGERKGGKKKEGFERRGGRRGEEM